MQRSLGIVSVSLIILTLVTLCGTACAQTEPTPAQVQRCIDRARDLLISQQRDDGGWPELNEYPYGVSGLATLALLSAGLSPDAPAIQRALGYVSQRELEKVYTVSLQTMALCAANPNRYAQLIQRNVRWLVKAQSSDGGWSYTTGAGAMSDPSNAQFALLALHEAQRVGIRPDVAEMKKCFDAARSYWMRAQGRDGGFAYISGGAPSASMTSAGVASLVIVGAQADQFEASVADQIRCCGQDPLQNQARIEAALAWLGQNFNPHTNAGGSDAHYLYYMYALERAGRLAGRRFLIGREGRQVDWYREGAHALIKRQDESGNFGTKTLGNSASEIAFGLLFLSKGKRQVVLNRLQFDPGLDWNHHPQSTQNLVGHCEQAWKRDLTWQTVRLQRATMQDLLEAPVLLISGTAAPHFSREEKLLLKRYVQEQGGFLFFEACHGNGCRGEEFEKYVQQLVVELFEQPLEKLPPDHPVWSCQARIAPQDLPPDAWLYGVQTCCRLGVVFVPYSLSCRWELNLPYGNRPDYGTRVQSDLDTATKIGLNVLTYATGKELKDKLDSVSILEEVVNKNPSQRGLFELPILMHSAGADDAPRAVKTLIQWLNQEIPFPMSSRKRLIPIEADELARNPVVFMHGRGKLELSAQEREALRQHFQAGGFLICNAICGDEAFGDSFRAQMQTILGQALKPLDIQHPLLTEQYHGFDIRQLSIIDPNRDSAGQISATTRKIAPVIEVGYADGRIVVAFSPLDMSCALESRHSLQCKGYVREDAARLGINLIMFALQQ
ncbi:MAG: DUF4159 domain-containing protein [Pirellulaceae bacterium]|nr:DUF4159 domain-containing protein [Pirellulaceae bacterium]